MFYRIRRTNFYPMGKMEHEKRVFCGEGKSYKACVGFLLGVKTKETFWMHGAPASIRGSPWEDSFLYLFVSRLVGRRAHCALSIYRSSSA